MNQCIEAIGKSLLNSYPELGQEFISAANRDRYGESTKGYLIGVLERYRGESIITPSLFRVLADGLLKCKDGFDAEFSELGGKKFNYDEMMKEDDAWESAEGTPMAEYTCAKCGTKFTEHIGVMSQLPEDEHLCSDCLSRDFVRSMANIVRKIRRG